MIKLAEGGFAELLPPCLKHDADIQAISYALQMGTARLLKCAARTRLLADIDNLPADIINLLALELRAQYYDESADIGTRRNIVKNALAWHMRAGTPDTVLEFIETIFGSSGLAEWYEYGANPFYFKTEVDVLFTEDAFLRLQDMLWDVKNVRSHIGVIQTQRITDGNVIVGAGVMPVYQPEPIICEYAAQKGG